MSYVVELIPGRLWMRHRLSDTSVACHSVDDRAQAVQFETHDEAVQQVELVRRQWPGYAEVVSVRATLDLIHEPAHYRCREEDTVHGLLAAIQTAVYEYDSVASVHGPGPDDGPCWPRWKEAVCTVTAAIEKLAKRLPVEDDGDLYAELDRVLAMARAHAAEGKGKERHAVDGQAFEEQVIVSDCLALGSSHGAVFQIVKKAKESVRLSKDRAIAELLGVINYAAAAVLVLERLDSHEERN